MDNYQTAVLDLLSDLIHEQQKTRSAITDLAEALAGVRREVVEEPVPPAQQPAQEAPTQPEVEAEADAPKEEGEAPTLADLRKLFAERSKAGKKEELKRLLFEKFGAVKLTDVNAENYAELKAMAEAV